MTKTCPHCHATVLSTSQPNRMGTTPEQEELYERFDVDDDYAFRFQYADGSAFQIYADGRAYIMAKDGSIRDKPKGVVTNRIPMLIGSVAKPRQDRIEELEAQIAALAATPAVGGEASETWAYIERLLHDECGLRLDEGLEGQRINCINAIKNGASPAINNPLLQAAIEFLNTGEGLHKIRVNGKMMHRKDVAAALAAPPASPLRGMDSVLLKWQEKLADLKDMKARGDLTPQWGESSLISAQTIVDDLTASAASPPDSPLRGRDAIAESLKPFAKAWEAYGDKPSDDTRLSNNFDESWLEGTLITFGDLRRASLAFSAISASPPEQAAAICPKCKTKLQGPRLVTPNPHKDRIAYWCLTCDYTTLAPEQTAAQDQDSPALMPPRTET